MIPKIWSDKVDLVKIRGDGDPRREKQCDSFKVFMACVGLTGTEKKIVNLGPNSKIKDARDAFGRSMRQGIIADSNGYSINPQDYIWQHSKDCTASIQFKYDLEKEAAGLYDQASKEASKYTSK
uniref:Uncharacterized protein n=1 Tax=Cryptomonas curvata TaxID=233186 RepID=A0A7S0MGI6_9CRYP